MPLSKENQALEQVELKSVIEDLNNATEDMNVHLSITFPSKDVTIFEEILIFDEISLIGSLGGSLGLFVGFSFFGYITWDYCISNFLFI